MTGLIYNKPDDPINFLENALAKIRQQPDIEPTWDMFIDNHLTTKNDSNRKAEVKTPVARVKSKLSATTNSSRPPTKETRENGVKSRTESRSSERMRPPSVMKAAEVARIPNVPIILFMGGPGGGKTRHAERVRDALADTGLVHICMPDLIRNAIAKYKDRYPEWKEAALRYHRGELIPNNLALALVKAEMGRNPDAKAFFLEGFPREARQVEDFEREVRAVNMALILDYDEATLRRHMETRGLSVEMIDARIREFKQKTLPSAKYFDDQRLLHLIPGEKDDQTIYERMKMLVQRAMDTGVPVLNSGSSSQPATPQPPQSSASPAATATTSAAVPAATFAATATSALATAAVVAEEARHSTSPTDVNESSLPTHLSRPPTSASRPPTRTSRPPSTGSRHSQPLGTATSQPHGATPSGSSQRISPQPTTPSQKPISESASRKGTPGSGSAASKASSVPLTPPKTGASQPEQLNVESTTPPSNSREQQLISEHADDMAQSVTAIETPAQFEEGTKSRSASVLATAHDTRKKESPSPINSSPVTAIELRESPAIQTAIVENVEERQPVLSTPITIPSTATSQRSNPHSNIATPVEEHLAASDEARQSNEAIESQSNRTTPVKPSTPVSIRSKTSAKSNKSLHSNKSIMSNKSKKSIASTNSKASKTSTNEQKPEKLKELASPTLANAIEVPVEVGSPAEREEEEREEPEQEGQMVVDSKMSSTASTPGPAGAAAAQLANVVIPDIASTDAARTNNDPFPHGLPNNAPVILVIGAPGSNKAAIAQRIAKKYDGFVYLSMGELLRREVIQNPDDELWQRIDKKMNTGEAVPMKICRDLLYSSIHDVGGRSWGYVIEGYPRTQAQAVDFENQFERLDLALLIDCTEQFCCDSIKKRAEVAKENNDVRPDDDAEVVKIRLAMFKQNTLPMLKYFDDKGKLRVVDGDMDIDKIFVEVTSAIDNTIFIEDQESGKSLTSSKDGSTDEKDRKDL
uniref:Adenylate kinase isoenzyme 5 n=1 Tax=Ascaris suum TaxID=6253 RepID=F1KUL8_ASCSU